MSIPQAGYAYLNSMSAKQIYELTPGDIEKHPARY